MDRKHVACAEEHFESMDARRLRRRTDWRTAHSAAMTPERVSEQFLRAEMARWVSDVGLLECPAIGVVVEPRFAFWPAAAA